MKKILLIPLLFFHVPSFSQEKSSKEDSAFILERSLIMSFLWAIDKKMDSLDVIDQKNKHRSIKIKKEMDSLDKKRSSILLELYLQLYLSGQY